MAGTSTPIFLQTPRAYVGQLVNATGTGFVSLVAGGTNGTKIDSLIAYSSDTASRDLLLTLNNGTTDYSLGTVNIPINSGNTNAIPTIDVLNHSQLAGLSVDSNGNKSLFVPSGWTLKISVLVAVTAAKVLNVHASGGDY